MVGLAHAQDDEARRAPPVEIPDFSNLDEYIYEPKSTLTFGVRYVSGAKIGFAGGVGQILSRNEPGEVTGTDAIRIYHDGAVQPDARSVGRVDDQGPPSARQRERAVSHATSWPDRTRYKIRCPEGPSKTIRVWTSLLPPFITFDSLRSASK